MTRRSILQTALLTLLILTLFPGSSNATFYGEVPRAGLHEQPFENGRYLVYLPTGYDQKNRYPLVLISNIYLGVPEVELNELMDPWMQLADERKYIVVLPIAGGVFPLVDKWYLALLDTLKDAYSIDSSRVLLTGFGAGAHYAIHLGATQPKLFRAVSPVAGILHDMVNSGTYFAKRNRPDFYFLSGAEDKQTPPEEVRAVADLMRDKGYSVRFEKLAGLGHVYVPEFASKVADWFDQLSSRD